MRIFGPKNPDYIQTGCVDGKTSLNFVDGFFSAQFKASLARFCFGWLFKRNIEEIRHRKHVKSREVKQEVSQLFLDGRKE